MACREGIDQWRPGSFPRRCVADQIERGEMYLFRMGGQPVGTMVLQWSDEEAWGDVPEDAGYVHWLAVRRDHAGRGLGNEFLDWAEDRTVRSGKRCLRLDCAVSNRALNEYYERAGFSFRGWASVWGLEVSLYEKKVGVAGPG